MKPEEEDVTFDLPGSLGNKLDISREHSLRALSGSMMSPDSSRDGTSATGSESHLVILNIIKDIVVSFPLSVNFFNNQLFHLIN
jgi:hypothetical protein